MRTAIRLVLLLGALGSVCGCGDSPANTIRDALATRNELVDAMLKVTDEASAKGALAGDMKDIQKRWDDNIRKRIDDGQRSITGGEKALKRFVEKKLEEVAQQQAKAGTSVDPNSMGRLLVRQGLAIPDDLLDTASDYFAAQDAVIAKAGETEATAKRLTGQLSRLHEIVGTLVKKETAAKIAEKQAGKITSYVVNARDLCPNLVEVIKVPEKFGRTDPDAKRPLYYWDPPLELKTVRLPKVPIPISYPTIP